MRSPDRVGIGNFTGCRPRWIFVYLSSHICRSQQPRGLRRRFTASRLLRSWVRIPPGAWMFVVSVVCCHVQVSATDWSLVQRNPTDCGASLCVIKKSRTREGYSPARGLQNTNPQRVVAPVEKKSFSVNRTFARYTVEKYGKTRHAIDNNIIPCVRCACWITKTTNTNSNTRI